MSYFSVSGNVIEYVLDRAQDGCWLERKAELEESPLQKLPSKKSDHKFMTVKLHILVLTAIVHHSIQLT